LLLVLIAGYYVLRSLRFVLGVEGYIVSIVVLFGVSIPLVAWRSLKNFPEGSGITHEKSTSVNIPFEQLISTLPLIVEKCQWKLAIADAERGYFKGKIGRSFQTGSGQLFQIDVKRMNDASSEVRIRIEAYHQIVDYGQNKKMIDKFCNQLFQAYPLGTPQPTATYHTASREVDAMQQHKDASFAVLIAAVGGIFTFGLGHFYVGRIGRGLVLIIGGSLLKIGLGWLYYLRGGIGLIVVFALLNVGLWMWQAYDAYTLARKYNTALQQTGKAPW